MKKEISGLVTSMVLYEMPWEPWMKGQLIPTHRIDERPSYGKSKSHFAAEGNRIKEGVHFDAVATFMPTQTAVKMVVLLAAGLCQSFLPQTTRELTSTLLAERRTCTPTCPICR